jgi:hypothetical protein
LKRHSSSVLFVLSLLSQTQRARPSTFVNCFLSIDTMEIMQNRINAVRCLSENKFCCECSAKRPTFAAIICVPGSSSFRKAGIFICFRCSEVFKQLHEDTVVVVNKTFEEWGECKLSS